MDQEKDLAYLIDKTVSSNLFWEANYYFRSMKKQPHGGVAHILYPNVYLKHYPADTVVLFRENPKRIPFFLSRLFDETLSEFFNCKIDIEELLWFCFDDGSFWYVGFRLLEPKREYEEINKKIPLICTVISSKHRFQDYFKIDIKFMVYALICFLIKSKMTEINGIDEICQHEQLTVPHNKYGLTLVNEAEFFRQGFVLNDKYYLYNIFFDTTIGGPVDKVPYTIRVILSEIHDKNFYIRCDENLSVPKDEMISTATMDFQKYRGININFTDIENVVFKKEIVVHFDPERLDKVVMIIKPETDEEGRDFYHLAVEELWNPKRIRDDFVITNYIHAKYYPEKKGFNHIDFSVNQYSKGVFSEKYKDAVSDTKVPIDRYGDKHYKIWCVDSPQIEIETWSKLVCVTLDEPFRDVFHEMFTL